MNKEILLLIIMIAVVVAITGITTAILKNNYKKYDKESAQKHTILEIAIMAIILTIILIAIFT